MESERLKSWSVQFEKPAALRSVVSALENPDTGVLLLWVKNKPDALFRLVATPWHLVPEKPCSAESSLND